MTDTQSGDETRCGFVAVIGAPNAGKSTFINALVGSKVSIVSPKVQTTRTMVRGMIVKDRSQIIFIDTPGIFSPQKRLEKAMVAAAWQGRDEADIVLVMVDASRKKIDPDTRAIVERLAAVRGNMPCVLLLNKFDQARKDVLLKMAAELNSMLDFTATFMISALKQDGTDDVLAWLTKNIPAGVWHYPEDQISDMPSRLLAAEVTREKLFRALYQELPYALTVETETWEEFDNGDIKISQIIYVTRDTHKAIVLGKGGQQIREIGEAARLELQDIFECKVHLKLFVKVDQAWLEDRERYEVWGLDFNA
ncbi:MAG: GTPase Era [Alphaproteobacteria bacterium]|nr:GTPase Era [Alphaproteobacteria bacterium]